MKGRTRGNRYKWAGWSKERSDIEKLRVERRLVAMGSWKRQKRGIMIQESEQMNREDSKS